MSGLPALVLTSVIIAPVVLEDNCIVFTGTEIVGKEAVVLGRSKIVVRKH